MTRTATPGRTRAAASLRPFPFLLRLSCLLALLLAFLPAARAASSPARTTLVKALIAQDEDERIALVSSLAGDADEAIRPVLDAWKKDAVYLLEEPAASAPVPILLSGEADNEGRRVAVRILDGATVLDSAGGALRLDPSSLTAAEHSSPLRRAMKGVIDLLDLASPDKAKRIQAITTLGFSQDVSRLPVLAKLAAAEKDEEALRTLRIASALISLKHPDMLERSRALDTLRELHPLSAVDFITAAQKEAVAAGQPGLVEGARTALLAIERHRSVVNFFGTLFRGLSLGSILLIVALGLAITFGLMKVINMAHGEMIAVGAYTTYIVQNIFGGGLALSPFGQSFTIPGLNTSGWAYESYFLVSLPISFLTAACVGILLERTVIRFLYRRPLESLLATWGVSLVLQQVFKLVFGANNVQVSSPAFLSGNWTVADIIFGYNRVFVIAFAVIIVVCTWLVLTRTSLGLLIRAVMQNRGMASCMGVRTERVNMLTFGLGSGLAGLAGAFLSQIGNVGPSLGQAYIVDCFMTVVVGGVGNLGGTIISALGIGMFDQSLQQILLNPVLGKILVLAAIILFLQWRPAGLFVTRSRSLDD